MPSTQIEIKPGLSMRAPYTRDPVARMHFARLYEVIESLLGELAERDEWIITLEDQVDDLRMVIGLAEVPL